jgi:hypothetical protein
METNANLKQFEFTIMPRASVVELVEQKLHQTAFHLPLMQVKVNFAKGKLLVNAEWAFIVSSNVHAKQGGLSRYKGRIAIDVSLFPAAVIDLLDPFNDGMVLPAIGIIKDSKISNRCSGLLTLEKFTGYKKEAAHGWDITFYLCDHHRPECEIKLKLPLYFKDTNQVSN